MKFIPLFTFFSWTMNFLYFLSSSMFKGLIYRGRKPVYWSPSSQTALAEAELEYADLPSSSAYVAMPLHPHPRLTSTSALSPGTLPFYAIIWTTTPWTLPANQAISIHPLLSYALVKGHGRERGQGVYLVACGRLETLKDTLFDGDVEVIGTITGEDLTECSYSHPFRKDR